MLATETWRYVLWRLAAHPWVREPERWRPRPLSRTDASLVLARYLWGRYPVPPFLLTAISRPGPDDVFVDLLAGIGRGDSLFARVRAGDFPVPLTRRMCHAYLAETPDGWDVVRAVRRAQALGHGGSIPHADAIGHSRLGARLRRDEEFWQTVIHWLVRHPEIDEQLDPLCDYVAHCHSVDRDWRISGRGPRALLSGLAEWQRSLAAIAPVAGARLPTSGLPGHEWRMDGIRWSMRELRTALALHNEGRTMRHCVYSYLETVMRGEAAIFTLAGEGAHTSTRLTVEVDPRSRVVVQAKGPRNRAITPAERRALRHWCKAVGIRAR